MEFFNDLIFKLKNNYFILLICLLFIVINDAIIISDLYKIKTNNQIGEVEKNIDNNKETNTIKIDIKGEVKKPGVYEGTENMNVNDAIKMAGGLKKGASTDNINLSKTLKNEMVIIISKKLKENIKNTIKNDALPSSSEVIGEIKNSDANNIQNDSNKLISLNKGSLDELMTIPGIGEQKAKQIIEYRNSNVFTSIEDIKNVSGIGESLFEKIKDYITI